MTIVLFNCTNLNFTTSEKDNKIVNCFPPKTTVQFDCYKEDATVKWGRLKLCFYLKLLIKMPY